MSESRAEHAVAYAELVRHVRRVVNIVVDRGANVLVASDGDHELLRLPFREGWHFPQDESGTWAGFFPAGDAEAIEQLEVLRDDGARYLVFPETGFWWLEHYESFSRHLETHYERRWEDECCIVFDLGQPGNSRSGRRRRTQIPAPLRPPGAPQPPSSGIVDIDIERTQLHQRFFSQFPPGSPEELFELVLQFADFDSFTKLQGAGKLGYGGWAYWLFFLKGYLEYVDTETIGKGNSYYEYLRRYVIPARRVDRGLAGEISNPLTGIERIARRFRDLDYYHFPGAHNPIGGYGPKPVKLIVSSYAPPHGGRPIYLWDAEAPLLVKRIDGHHRLFAARVFGRVEHRGEIVAEREELGHVRGAVEELRFDGTRLEIRGWCLDARRPIESFEVRRDDTAAGEVWVERRPDVEKRFPQVAHALLCGFSIDVEHLAPADSLQRFRVVPRADWLPVGALWAPYFPGMYEQGVSRLDALRAVKVLDGIVSALGAHRAPDSVRFVVVSESNVPLRTFVRGFLPQADLVDAEADLMLAPFVLSGLASRAQAGWLRKAHAVVRPGGYLAVSTLGELVRPFLAGSPLGDELDEKGVARGERTYQTREHAEALCARWFDVVEYVVGGVDDEQDLILLRRR